MNATQQLKKQKTGGSKKFVGQRVFLNDSSWKALDSRVLRVVNNSLINANILFSSGCVPLVRKGRPIRPTGNLATTLKIKCDRKMTTQSTHNEQLTTIPLGEVRGGCLSGQFRPEIINLGPFLAIFEQKFGQTTDCE
jgi:hypothetical protein